MKKVILSTMLLMCACFQLNAQQASSEPYQQKMAAMQNWIGRWQGEGSMTTQTGEVKKSSVDEKIEFKLDNTLLLVEGIGKYTDLATNKEIISHHALGLLSYDLATSQYKFKSWLKDGKSTDAWFNITAENQYQWGFDTPGGKIRYSIVLDPVKKTWNEIGEFSRDGNSWRKFFEMNLKKIEG
jgi:hypothetical protein